jgi:predicted DNA-binding protein (UPF0251 family)
MSRPKKCRCINCTPNTSYFKPKGIPIFELAAVRMKVSRATFGRILNKARSKVAEAIVDGKALRIETAQTKEAVNESMFRGSKR